MNVPEKHRAVAHAWVEGAEIEFSVVKDQWLPATNPTWDVNCKYRFKPTKPSIDWSHVGSKVVAIATDEDGASWCFPQVPEVLDSDATGWSGVVINYADIFASFDPGTCDWRDSLIVRPGYEEDQS